MSDTKHTPGNVRVGTIARIIKKGMNYGQIAWDIVEAVDEAIGVDAELAKVKAERDELIKFVEIESIALREAGFTVDSDRFNEFVYRIKAGQS